MAAGAEIDKGGFEAGFDPGHLALVDIGFLARLAGGFDIEIVQPLAVNQRDPEFFLLGRIDQNAFHAFIPHG